MKLQRRHFLQLASLTGTTFLIRPSVLAASPVLTPSPCADPFPVEPGARYFSQFQREVLSALAEYALPGASALGAARFIEQILTAFDFAPPRIFHDGENFIPLNRVQEKAWRLRLYGSSGCGGSINDQALGPVMGLREEVQSILDQASQVLQTGTYPFTTPLMISAWTSLETGLQERMVELAVQASLADPAYGGNLDGGGWKLVFFEGQGLPAGYSSYDEATRTYAERADHPLSSENPGADPMQVSWITMAQLRFKRFKG